MSDYLKFIEEQLHGWGAWAAENDIRLGHKSPGWAMMVAASRKNRLRQPLPDSEADLFEAIIAPLRITDDELFDVAIYYFKEDRKIRGAARLMAVSIGTIHSLKATLVNYVATTLNQRARSLTVEQKAVYLY